MKLILAGASGFIGHEVLSRALTNPKITSLIALSRKPLPELYSSHPKLLTIIHNDFTSYPPSLMTQLAGAEGCIWMIGAKSISVEVTQKVSVDYTMAAARAFSQLAQEQGEKFRFVFVSGIIAARDQEKSLWFYEEVRKLAGHLELQLLDLRKEDKIETFVMRPAAVLTKEKSVMNSVRRSLPFSIRVDELASVLIDVAINGSKEESWENDRLRTRGKELLTLEVKENP